MRQDSLLAFVAGAALGATLGILFAPDKGEVTRRKIKEAAKEGYDTVKEKAEDFYSAAKSKAETLHSQLNDLKAILKEEGSEMKDEARARLLDQLDRLERAIEKEDHNIDEQYV